MLITPKPIVKWLSFCLCMVLFNEDSLNINYINTKFKDTISIESKYFHNQTNLSNPLITEEQDLIKAFNHC